MRSPEEIKRSISMTVIRFPSAIYDSNGMKGAVIGLLNKACGGNGERKLLLKYIFGKESSKELTGAEWIGLMQWVELKNVGDDWLPQKDFYTEAEEIVNEACGIRRYRLD